MKTWVVTCSDNVIGVASSQARADELYSCGHSQDSTCCFTEEHEIDAAPRRMQRPSRHRPPVVQDTLL